MSDIPLISAISFSSLLFVPWPILFFLFRIKRLSCADLDVMRVSFTKKLSSYSPSLLHLPNQILSLSLSLSYVNAVCARAPNDARATAPFSFSLSVVSDEVPSMKSSDLYTVYLHSAPREFPSRIWRD